MVTKYPGATWRPYTKPVSTTPLQHDVICAHTIVGTVDGAYAHGNTPGKPYHMFGLKGNGELQQHHDLDTRSAANLEGNSYIIPIETADSDESFAPWSPKVCGKVPPWTDAQIDKLIELSAWLCVRYDIPPVLIPDSIRGHRGMAYHRQGCIPNLVEGGDNWSKSTGKCCPDGPRIDQWTDIVIPAVAAIVGGDVPFTPAQEEIIVAGAEASSNLLKHDLRPTESPTQLGNLLMAGARDAAAARVAAEAAQVAATANAEAIADLRQDLLEAIGAITGRP